MKPKLIPQEDSIKKPFFVSLVIILLCAVLIGIQWHNLPPEVPLFFSRPWGNLQLAPVIYLSLPLGLSLLLLLVNLILVASFESIFLKKVLIIGGLISALLAVITVARIVFLIG